MNDYKKRGSRFRIFFTILSFCTLMLVVAAKVNNAGEYTLAIQEAVPGCSGCFKETRYYYNAYSELTNTYYEPVYNEDGQQRQMTRYIYSERPEYTGTVMCQTGK